MGFCALFSLAVEFARFSLTFSRFVCARVLTVLAFCAPGVALRRTRRGWPAQRWRRCVCLTFRPTYLTFVSLFSHFSRVSFGRQEREEDAKQAKSFAWGAKPLGKKTKDKRPGEGEEAAGDSATKRRKTESKAAAAADGDAKPAAAAAAPAALSGLGIGDYGSSSSDSDDD